MPKPRPNPGPKEVEKGQKVVPNMPPETTESPESDPQSASAAEPSPNPGAQGLMEAMERRLKAFKLAPSPVPRRLIETFAADLVDEVTACAYCGSSKVVGVVFEVSFNLQAQTAKLLRHKGACARCYQIADLKTLNNHAAQTVMRRRSEFDAVYEHFLEINRIKDRNGTELQEAMAVANTLQVIYTEIPWKRVHN